MPETQWSGSTLHCIPKRYRPRELFSLHTLLRSIGDLRQHRCDDGTADSSSDEFKQRVRDGRREIRDVPDPIVDEIHAEPHQKAHDRTDLEAVHDRRGTGPGPDCER